MKKISRRSKIIVVTLLLFALLCGGWGYKMLLLPNTAFMEKSRIVLIEHEEDLATWLESVQSQQIIANTTPFTFTAKLKKFTHVKAGRYRFAHNMSNNAMVNMLRSGNQEAIKLRIDDVHDIYSLAGKLGKNMQSDSLAFASAFTDPSLTASYGFNAATIACMFVPDTYDFFWTMTPADFMKKMNGIYSAYWTPEKKEAAKKIGLNETQVGILASIVKAETANLAEAKKIAGLYMNRLRINMALQSDPTSVFGRSSHVARVSENDLQNDSPYNTYKFTGLPPGPIDLTETLYLDAVLGFENHSYIYMCAQPGGTGYHNFSKSYDQHLVYRAEYTAWLDRQGIR